MTKPSDKNLKQAENFMLKCGEADYSYKKRVEWLARIFQEQEYRAQKLEESLAYAAEKMGVMLIGGAQEWYINQLAPKPTANATTAIGKIHTYEFNKRCEMYFSELRIAWNGAKEALINYRSGL